MGLYVSHDCWNGAYSAFYRWRNKLAEVAGYEVKPHTYPDGLTWDTATIVVDGDWTEENFKGYWPRPPEDPLILLLVHSDYDGRINSQHAYWLAERLERLIPLLPDEVAPGHIGHWRDKTWLFVNGLRKAHEAGEDVTFH